MHRRLPHARSHARANVTGVDAAAPFEPHVLPGLGGAIGNLGVRLCNAETGNGSHRVSTEGNARSHLTEGRCGFEELDVEMGMAAQIQCQGDAGNTAADDADTQGRLGDHVCTHDVVVGVKSSWAHEKY
ncbi:hypothetical protein D3C73_1379450 [compost metagenome]